MGALRARRGQWLGEALLASCIEKAFAKGLTRIEPEQASAMAEHLGKEIPIGLVRYSKVEQQQIARFAEPGPTDLPPR